MTAHHMYPVDQPLFTSVLVDEIAEASRKAGPKPHAADTRFRYSDCGSCARKMSYVALGIEPSDPFDLGSLWVMWIGTMIHEHLQAALEKKFPGAKSEVVSVTPACDSSGSADEVAEGEVITSVVVEWQGGKTLYELKTMGGYAFKKSIGLSNTKGGTLGDPDGPRMSAILQGAVNALANDCETLIVGEIALESVSKGIAYRTGMRDRDRFIAEWQFPRAYWEPLARREIARQAAILARLDSEELLGERVIVDDNGEELKINPDASRPHWSCSYCSHQQRCLDDGPDPVPVPVELKESA